MSLYDLKGRHSGSSCALWEPSDEERRVLELLCRGYGELRIARELGVSVSTVRRRLRSASDALGARNRVHLAVIATRMGLANTDEGALGE